MKSVQMQMGDILDDISDDIKKTNNEALKETGKKVTKILMETSPKQAYGKTAGRYARGWRYKWSDGEVVVYNATDWQLTHLLEDGHFVVNRYGETGARTRAIKHILPASEEGGEFYHVRVSRGLK